MQPFAYLQMPWALGDGVTPSLCVSPYQVVLRNDTQSLQVLILPRDTNGSPITGNNGSASDLLAFAHWIDCSIGWSALVSSQAITALQALQVLGNVSGQDFSSDNATLVTSPVPGLQMNWSFGAGVSLPLLVVIRGAIVNMDQQQFLLQVGPVDSSGNFIGPDTNIDISNVINTGSTETCYVIFAGYQVVPVLQIMLKIGGQMNSSGGPDFTNAVIMNVDGSPYVG